LSEIRHVTRRVHTEPLPYRWVRRIVVGIVGGTVLAIGIALLVLPGPAFVVIPIGLAILGAEFAWARHWLRVARARSADLVNLFRAKPAEEPPQRMGSSNINSRTNRTGGEP
jgi:tellurite resistance protein TerC